MQLHDDLIAIQQLVYLPANFSFTTPIPEAESAEYGAYTFQLNDYSIRFRVAKTTPTKAGQFVTLWKRQKGGPIQPFDHSDPIDFFVISARKENHFGQFIFPKSVLCEQGVVSTNNQGGKRAIRVYPPWETFLNKQAEKTQQWQIKYFLEIPSRGKINLPHLHKIFGIDDSLNSRRPSA